MKLKDWEKNNIKDDGNILAPPMKAQDAIKILIEEILGPDWYVSYPCNGEQANTEAVYDIIDKFKELRKSFLVRLFGK